MDEKDRKKGFWGSLLRSGSLATRPKPQEKRQTRRKSEGDAAQRRRRRPGDENRNKTKPKVRRAGGEPTSRTASPLTEWPPNGMPPDKELTKEAALELISRGAPRFKGFKRSIPHAPESYFALYATASGNKTDTSNLTDAMVQLMTFRMQGPGEATSPWSTLEQPSCAFMFGNRPGTITLNHWACLASEFPESIKLRDSGVMPRPMELEHICERLRELQAGLEDDDESLLYKILYKRILRDPDRILNPHKTLDKQIMDLILVLSRPGWIDFTDAKNQVATRFIFDAEATDPEIYQKFLHQLLLSMELEMRIHSTKHGDWAKEKLSAQIPPTIQWNLALARRWREHVRIDAFGNEPAQVKLRYKLKKKQVKSLKRFATTMKWPNLTDTLQSLQEHDEASTLDTISSDAFAFFSGLVLPGPTFPFLIMNTLLDLDPDEATDDLALLSHIHPNSGFQYRNSYTYWAASCIVGKVLAPTCRALAGWIGPARPTTDLGKSRIARIRTRKSKQQRVRAEDVESIAERSDALGPPAEVYPVKEYVMVSPEEDGLLDLARIELLSLKPVPGANAGDGPGLYDATVQFAIDGVSWPLHLTYDVSFISAWPCSDGPHVLFFDYIFKAVPVDDLVHVQDWGGRYRKPVLPQSARSTPAPDGLRGVGGAGSGAMSDDAHQEEEVLVIEAMGVKDNEVLARAWCSHWGLSAVVADIGNSCMACAIRECYAAALTVLILVEDKEEEDDD